MSSRANSWSGHLAAAGAYAIFGFNIIFCKDIAQSGAVTPIVLFTLRAIGATALFWALSLFLPLERVPGRELLRIALASFLGLFVPQLTFLAAIGMTTSIDAAVLSSLTPVYTMCFAFLFLGEPITGKKVTGVAVSLLGVLLLIFNSVHDTGGPDRTQSPNRGAHRNRCEQNPCFQTWKTAEGSCQLKNGSSLRKKTGGAAAAAAGKESMDTIEQIGSWTLCARDKKALDRLLGAAEKD